MHKHDMPNLKMAFFFAGLREVVFIPPLNQMYLQMYNAHHHLPTLRSDAHHLLGLSCNESFLVFSPWILEQHLQHAKHFSGIAADGHDHSRQERIKHLGGPSRAFHLSTLRAMPKLLENVMSFKNT